MSKGWLDNYGEEANYNESKVTFPEGYVGYGYDTTGRNYSPAWGGQFQMGGSIPGAVGFTYARTDGAAPANGKYAKKTTPSAQNGLTQSIKDFKRQAPVTDTNRVLIPAKKKVVNPMQRVNKELEEVKQIQDEYNISREGAIKLRDRKKFEKAVNDSQFGTNPYSVKASDPEQSIASKTWEVLTNPATAASYIVQNQHLPDHFSKGERNSVDTAIDFVNPFGVADSVYNIGSNIIDLSGNIIDRNPSGAVNNLIGAGTNALSVLPMLHSLGGAKGIGKGLHEFIGTPAQIKELETTVGSMLKNTDLTGAPALKGLDKELSSTVRKIGSMSRSGDVYSDIDLLENVLDKSNTLSDKNFKNLIGFEKSELENRLKTLKEGVSKNANKKVPPKQINSSIQQLGSDNNIDNQVRERINLYDSDAEYLDALDPRNSTIGYDFRVPEFVSRKPIGENSLVAKINNRISPYIKQQDLDYNNVTSLVPSLYKSQDNNPAAIMKSAITTLREAPKGTQFIPAGSLSSDSFPMSHKLMIPELKNNTIDLGFHGFAPMNSSGFATQAGIDPKITLKEANNIISEINKHTDKKVPFAKMKGNNIEYPIISVTRKKNGGMISNNWLDQYEDGGVVKDDNGYWNPDNWGKVVEIDSNDITMQGVDQPLIGVSDEGDIQYMEPGKDYKFKGKKVTEYPVAQKGKTIKTSNMPYDVNDIKKFYNNVYNSDWYRDRLINNGYANVVKPKGPYFGNIKDENKVDKIINVRKKALDNLNYREESSAKVSRTPWIPSEGSYYNYDNNAVIYDPNQSDKLRAYPQSIIAHEIGHSETENAGLNRYEANLLQKKLNRWNPDIDAHDRDPYENKSDINAIRYNLYKKGLFDPNTGKYKTKSGKFENNLLESIKDDFSTNRLQRNYTKDNLEYLINTIADNADGELVPIAKNGINNLDGNSLQNLDQLVNFTNYNTKQPGGWLDKY